MMALSLIQTSGLTALAALKIGSRDRTVLLLGAMFFTMILISAWLGWSATNTVNAIYDSAVPVLKAQGRPVPPNPVGETSPLTLFRNMVTYIALLGALASLVLGHQIVAADRKSGALPLLFSRPLARQGLALGKIAALALAIIILLVFAAIVNALTMLFLPGLALNAAVWSGLVKFYSISALYMLAFGLLGAASAVYFKSQSMALLVPVTIWLALTFIVPQLTANISPMAALNPLSANITPPSGRFFGVTSAVLGPVSIAESYRYLASSALDILPGARATLTSQSALLSLILANLVLAAGLAFAMQRLDVTRSSYND